MAENLVIESPDFDEIEKKAGRATRDAVNLLWSVMNQEILLRRRTVKDAKDTLEVKIDSSAPSIAQDNFETNRATVYYFSGGSAFNLTGIRNGLEGTIKFLFNTGAGTVTIKNASGSSDAANQILTSTAADKSLTTNLGILLIYLNARWREFKIL